MRTVALPTLGTWEAWRDAARACLAAGLPPGEVLWTYDDGPADLFSGSAPPPAAGHAGSVPRSFIELAETVVWHRDAERFARLYALLWRVRQAPVLMNDRGDPELSTLRAMEKSVRRCQHKMKAFVRFRDIGPRDAARRSFAAWFEPLHHTLEPTAPFFAARFADMDWQIVTPELTAVFQAGSLTFAPGQARPPLPDDATEELWAEYFRSIFNPARLKVKAMQSEMPKRYWANMPEARAIPALIAGAEDRARAMREAAPTAPPLRAIRLAERRPTVIGTGHEPKGMGKLKDEAAACTRCPLYKDATQVVMGEGPHDAELMFVGEQPGDKEDLAGRPFVGPAGQLLDEACEAAGIDRRVVFVTNAVKHFKYSMRGKRRLHQRPNSGEVSACKWWLETERSLVKPRLIVALGATAAESLTGTGKGILSRRGRLEETSDGAPIFLTIHPSYLLRLRDAAAKAAETERFQAELRAANEHLEKLRAA
jgi:uracil-DNA glycosylase